MGDSESSRQILRSTAIIGGSTAVNVAIGLVRTKVAALILGPAGVGLVGLFHNVIATASTVAGFGITNVAVRQIAAAGADAAAVSAARRALAWAALALGLAGSLALFLLREPIARLVLDDAGWSDEIGWLAIGVGLMVGVAAQNGFLVGSRRIGDLARFNLWSAALGTVAAIAALLLWREDALLAFVLISPAVTFLVGAYFVRRLPRPETARLRLGDLAPHWRALARLGLAFTIGSLAAIASQLAIRSLVQRELGAVGLGYFQASWAISANYIGFVMAAMVTDYYPRLTAVIGDHDAARRAVNEQTALALLLAGPLLVAVIGLAPWLLPLLYSSEFLPAADMLRWQIVGDLFKIASWPLGFILLAAGQARTFAISEIATAGLFVATTALLLPGFGLAAPGMAYLATYLAYLAIVLVLARRSIGHAPTRQVVTIFAAVAAAVVATFLLSFVDRWLCAAASILLAGALLIQAQRELHDALPAPVARILSLLTGPFGGRRGP